MNISQSHTEYRNLSHVGYNYNLFISLQRAYALYSSCYQYYTSKHNYCWLVVVEAVTMPTQLHVFYMCLCVVCVIVFCFF